MSEISKKRLLELAGIESTVNQTASTPLAPNALQQYAHINMNPEKINYKVEITCNSNTFMNYVCKQISLYQLGEVSSYENSGKDGDYEFKIILKPSVEKDRILDILQNFFGANIHMEIKDNG